MPISSDDHKGLPKGLQLIQTLEREGDSMFESLLIAIKDAEYAYKFSHLPETCQELCIMLVSEILSNFDLYKIKNIKENQQRFKMMSPGQLPCSETLLEACKFNIKIHVHHGMKSPILFQCNHEIRDVVPIHLQCVSLIHYNPLY